MSVGLGDGWHDASVDALLLIQQISEEQAGSCLVFTACYVYYEMISEAILKAREEEVEGVGELLKLPSPGRRREKTLP